MIYIAFLSLTFLILLLAFYQWQHYLFFTPTYHREEKIFAHCEILSLQTDDGIKLEGALHEPENARSTLLVFVGRSHDGVALINRLSLYYPDTRVIVFNYRSYGKSEGVVSEKNLLKDGMQIAKVVQKNYGDFYILGFSLGTNIGAYVAVKHKVKALFLVGAFDSLASLTQSKYKINVSKLLRYKFNTAEYVQNVKCDTYLFVSKDDETTYLKNSRLLKKEIANLTYYVELEGLSHKEILWSESVIAKINEVME